jgi:excisionase family DNA binding protein
MATNYLKLVTPAEFSRQLGVSQAAVSRAIKNGRLPSYIDGRGRRWLEPMRAARDWDANRVRIDNWAIERED